MKTTIATKTIILNNTVVFIIVYFLLVQLSFFVLLFIRRNVYMEWLQLSELFFHFFCCPPSNI